ncbi:rolling circle replication-associated protein [Pectinatus haikarae]|uniref:rolling circle replication-associated protein n=1 Tax=Pectinatus haikarae TaxID=349096 RepID=UPI0018C6F9A6|nr:hypothetical protein [Pectinatus haikarae]
MPYMKKIRKTINKKVIEKTLYYTYRTLPKDKKIREKRAGRVNHTPERQKEINRLHAANKLALKIANNFKIGDWYLTMTIAGKAPPKEKVKKSLDLFMVNLRRYYKRKNSVLKYIAVLENLKGAGRPHAHMLINSLAPEDMAVLQRYWTLGRLRIEMFGGQIEDCTRLAAYFKKEDVEEHSGRLRTSTNLINPVEEKEKVTRSECYSQRITPPKGYHVNKQLTYQSYTKDGYPCQRIIFVRD